MGLVFAALLFGSGAALAAPVQAATYDPSFVTASYSNPVCLSGVLDNDSTVTSFNAPGGFESITFSLDGVALPGYPYALATGTEVRFDDVVPANTLVGNHTLTVDNFGFTLATYPFTLAEPCVAVSPSDFTANLDTQFTSPDGSFGQVLELGNFSEASRQAVVWVNDVLVWAPVLAVGDFPTFKLSIPTCQAYSVKVSFGFPDLALDTAQPAYGCNTVDAANFVVTPKSPVCSVAVPTQETSVTSADPVSRFVKVTYGNGGYEYTASGTMAQGEMRSFVGQLPPGEAYRIFVYVDDELVYNQLQPAFSCGTPPVRLTGPSISGRAQVGYVLTCNVSYSGTAPVMAAYRWYLNGVLTAGSSRTLTLTATHYNKRLACASSASNGFGSAPSATSAASAVVVLGSALKIVGTYYPKVTGTVRVGKTVKAYVGKWTPAPTKYLYQWYKYSGGRWVAIKYATKYYYVIPRALKGYKIAVRVTALKPGYASGVRLSAGVHVG